MTRASSTEGRLLARTAKRLRRATGPAQGNVVRLPLLDTVAWPLARHRITGPFEVDDWGRDPELVRLASGLASLRWRPSVDGVHHLPVRSGALLVVNARRFALTPLLAAWALGEAAERPVRFVGHPDIAPTGPLLRRLGALLDHPLEVQAALRAGELVVVGTAATGSSRVAGAVPIQHVGAALKANVGVYPVAVVSAPLYRRARIEVGTLVRARRHRRGPLAEVELAEQVQRRLQRRLEEISGLGGLDTVLDWRREA